MQRTVGWVRAGAGSRFRGSVGKRAHPNGASSARAGHRGGGGTRESADGLAPFLAFAAFAAVVASASAAAAAGPDDGPPLLDANEAAAIAAEVSGSTAKRNVQALSLYDRMRGSEGYRAAAELIRDRLRDYGLKDVEISRARHGKTFRHAALPPPPGTQLASLGAEAEGRAVARRASNSLLGTNR